MATLAIDPGAPQQQALVSSPIVATPFVVQAIAPVAPYQILGPVPIVNARATAVVAEVLFQPSNPPARATAVVIEVLATIPSVSANQSYVIFIG